MSASVTESKSLAEFTEKAYLDYSMYVILDRALPHIADGLKPVQRRIIYAMSELGLHVHNKHKKSARTIGDVLGKFHPHGDSACYEAMVLMAQSFSYRYPLIDGQGNWGSTDDPKSFAAMRYTEARLSEYAELLLSELGQGTVQWVDNFDGTLQEPKLLPARLPNVLLNGATGIAVGMSADILPHNLVEVANACIYLLDNPLATLDDICQYILAPDFPTSAEIITTPEQIKMMYANGIGAIKMRAVYTQEQPQQIVISALPHQISGAKIIEQIAQQLQQKKLPMLEDIRDESNHENPVRLVLILDNKFVNIADLMLHLFVTTDLECSYRVNFNMIGLDGKPKVKNLLTILTEWLIYRRVTVKNRLQYLLDKTIARLHILCGFLLVYLNIDQVIAIIRADNDPKQELMLSFSLSDVQAEAILDMKLRYLARLEELKLQQELDLLMQERDKLQQILSDANHLDRLIKTEIIYDRDRFADARRSPLVTGNTAQLLTVQEIIKNEPITVILSTKGWIRAANGHNINGENLNYKVGDNFKMQINAHTNQQILFFDSQGKVYSLLGNDLPSARSTGEPLTTKLNPNENQTFIAMITGNSEDRVILASDAGYGFCCYLKNLYVKNRNGKNCIKLSPNSVLLSPIVLDAEQQLLACVSNIGHLLIFNTNDLMELTSGKGNKLLNIVAKKHILREEFVKDWQALSQYEKLVVHAGKRHYVLQSNELKNYYAARGQRGKLLPRGLQNVTKLTIME